MEENISQGDTCHGQPLNFCVEEDLVALSVDIFLITRTGSSEA